MRKKHLSKSEKSDAKIRLDRLKLEIVNANFTRMRHQDDPLFAASESSFRRGFCEALHYILLFIALSPADRRSIEAFLKRVIRWKQRLAEDAKQSYPPIPTGKQAERILKLGAKPNPKKKP